MSDTFVITTKSRYAAFDAGIPPVLTVDPGATITFETGDVAYERLSKGETVEAIGLPNFNLVTGPVAVRGAEPGDALVIEVLEVAITRAWSVWLPGFGAWGAYTQGMQVMEVPIADGRCRLSERLSVPLEPMIGCIGVAPATGQGSTFMPAYHWGGNMDLRELSPGATLYLPVQTAGALLSLGDLHAAMGAGEPTWVSLEAAGKATVRLSLQKAKNLRFPRLRVGGELLCLGMGESLAVAHQAAADEAFAYLTQEQGLEPFEAYAFASARMAMRLGGPASAIVMAALPEQVLFEQVSE